MNKVFWVGSHDKSTWLGTQSIPIQQFSHTRQTQIQNKDINESIVIDFDQFLPQKG
jgi:hypothetical protein